MEKYEILFGNDRIEYYLEIKKVKNININVRPDGTILVTANNDISNSKIEEVVSSKSKWILQNLNYFNKLRSEVVESNKKFLSGESIKYLGRQYMIKVVEDSNEEVKISDNLLIIKVKDPNNYNDKLKLYKKWINDQCKIIFSDIFKKWYPKFEKYGIEKPKLSIRTMKTKWGSCIINKNHIILNRELIKAPKFCIEYVVVHELTHLMHINHDDKFYSFLSTLFPEWEYAKKVLDIEVVREI